MSNPATNLPSNIEAERALLGAMILDNRLIDVALERIPGPALAAARATEPARRGADPGEPLFFSAANQMIFGAILGLHDHGAGVDLTTLAEALLVRGQLALVGGAPAIAALEDDIFSLGQVAQYADIVVSKWRLRSIVRACGLIAAGAAVEGVTADAAQDAAESAIFELSQSRAGRGPRSVSDGLPDLMTDIEAAAAGQRGPAGIHLGMARTDAMLDGLQSGQLMIVAARPGVGKSALALNWAANIALRQRQPVALFSLEMSYPEIMMRLVGHEAGLLKRVLVGRDRATSYQLDLAREAAERINGAPLYIDDEGGLTPASLASKIRRLKSRNPELGLVIVDYLGLMNSSSTRRGGSRYESVSDISKDLKTQAGALGVAIIALAQLNRESVKRGLKNPMPRMSDLRDSGGLEQDADIVALIHRERKEDEKANAYSSPKPYVPEEALLIIDKNRNGPMGRIPMIFDGRYYRFVELDTRHSQPEPVPIDKNWAQQYD